MTKPLDTQAGTTVAPPTGWRATSSKLTAGVSLASLGTLVTSLVQTNGNTHLSMPQAVVQLVSLIVPMVVGAVKLVHDKGIHVATIQAIDNQMAVEWHTNSAQIESDLASVHDFIANTSPGLAEAISDHGVQLEALRLHIDALATQIGGFASIEDLLHRLQADPGAPTPPAA